MTTPKHRRILAASLLLVLAIAGILAWQLTPPRDPILGRWGGIATSDPFSPSYHFHADHRVTLGEVGTRSTGTWKFIPGPYYERRPDPGILDYLWGIAPYPLASLSLIPQEQLESVKASGTYQISAFSQHGRLYECQVPRSGSDSAMDTYNVLLSGNKLVTLDIGDELERPTTWLTRVEEWFRHRLR